MKKIIFGLLILILLNFSGVQASWWGFTSDYSGWTITIESGVSQSISFANELWSIAFSKSSDISVRTLEAGIWRDVSNTLSDFKPLKWYIISNHAWENLEITYTYKANINSLDALIQRTLSPGWNLIWIARNNITWVETIEDGLGYWLDYSQVVDFTNSNFWNTQSSKLFADNFYVKSRGNSWYLQEGKAYAIFNSNSITFWGTQNLTDTNWNIIYPTTEGGNDSLCTTLNICPNWADLTSAPSTSLAYQVWDIWKSFGAIIIETSGEKDTIVESVTLRNEGTGDVAASLSNVELYSDGQKVSTDTVINGRDITFSLSSQIEKGESKSLELRADIIAVQWTSNTYEFRIRYDTDISMKEVWTGFSIPINLDTTPLSLGVFSVQDDPIFLSRDTTYSLNQTVSSWTQNVPLWAGNLSINHPITIEDMVIWFDQTGMSPAYLGAISSLRVIVWWTTVATASPTQWELGPITLNTSFSVNENTPIRIEANLRETASGNYSINSVTFGDVRYISSDETTEITGSVSGIVTQVWDATLTITRNDGIDNDVLVPGARDVTLIGFQLRASDFWDIRITAIRPTMGSSSVDLANISNVRLYQGSTLLSTRNNFDFNSINVTIPRNEALSFTIVADFNNAVTAGQTISLELSGSDVTARDVSNNQTVLLSWNVSSNLFTFAAWADVTITENPSQAQRSIITPSMTETSVFRFDAEAINDKVRVTDIYISNISPNPTAILAQSVRSASLTLGGQTANGVIISDSVIRFPFGSQGVLLERDDALQADMRIALFDSQTRTALGLQFALVEGNIVWQVSGTQNSMRVISDSTGAEIARTGGVISSNAHLLARSKPTIARDAEVNSSTAYKFSVTADANRKITLDTLVFNVRGINQTAAAFQIRRYGSNEIIAIETGDLVTSGTDITLAGFTLDDEVAAGVTVTYVLEISWIDTAANLDRTREVRLADLWYTDDVTVTPVVIQTAAFNILPTTPSTFRY